MTSPKISERTIMKKRPCKHCGAEVYLQYIPVTSSIKWVSFDAADGRLHSRTNKPLDFVTRKLVQETIANSEMASNTKTKEEIVHSIISIIDSLKDLKQDMIKLL